MGFLPILVLLFLVMWFLVIRPQRQRQQEQKRIMDNLSRGQEVLTVGGVYGTVQSVLEDEVRVEIAPGVDVRVARRAIAAVITGDEEDELAELERAQEEAKEEVLAARDARER